MAYLLIYKPPKPAMLPLPAADGDDDKHGSEALQLSAAMDFLEAAYARYLAGRDYASALVVMQEIVNTHAGSVRDYIRMAQCHELLKDIKSAIGALDFAFIVAADAETQKCIREHRHRLEAQMQAQIEARKQATQRNMVQFLPKEVVIRIMQNLSDLDLVRAAQTNKFWRSCIHNYPPLWTSLSLFFPHEVETSALRLNLVNAKLKFHEDRLPLTSRAIIHLSICSYASMRCILEADLPGELELLLSGRHRFFTPGLQSISLLGYCREQCLLARWSQEARLGSLSCLTLLAGPLKYPLSKILQLCPRLRRISYLNNDALDPFCGSITQSADNLYENEQDGGGLPQNRGLKRWVIHPSKYHAPFIMGEADHHLLTDLEHLELGAVEDPSKLPRTESETSISDSESEAATLDYDCQAKPPLGPNFFSTFSMASLRILRLVDAQFSTAFQWPEDLLNDGHVNRLGLKVEGSVLDEALETPLDMPNLAICQLIQAAGSDNCAPERFCAHPSHLLCRLRAPRLLHLTLSGYGQMLVNSDPEAPLLRPLQYKSWSVFSQNHSQLKELYVFDTDLPEPEGLGKNFPDLNVLCLSGFRLPDDFLDPKGLERFPRLRYLMLMRCVKLDYWRFELSLKDMQRELQYWQEHIRPEENWRKVAFGTAPRLAQIAQRVQLGTHEMLLQGMTTL